MGITTFHCGPKSSYVYRSSCVWGRGSECASVEERIEEKEGLLHPVGSGGDNAQAWWRGLTWSFEATIGRVFWSRMHKFRLAKSQRPVFLVWYLEMIRSAEDRSRSLNGRFTFSSVFHWNSVDEEIAIHDSGQRLCAKKGLAVMSFGNGFLLFSLSCARVVTSRRGRKRGRVSIVIVLRGTSRYLVVPVAVRNLNWMFLCMNHFSRKIFFSCGISPLVRDSETF